MADAGIHRGVALALSLAALLAVSGCKKGEEIPGDPARFDPVENFAAVQAYVGSEWGLVSMSASEMRLDGTLDLTTKEHKPNAQYHFEAEAAPPKDAPPPGSSGSSSDGRWHGSVAVSLHRKGTSWHVSERGGNVNREYTLITRGMLATDPKVESGAPQPVVPAPKCKFGELWKQVDPGTLPAHAVVDGRYGAQGYEIRDGVNSVSYWFDFDCRPKPEG
ncbi:MAG: hypothetical protein R6X02_18035 [Enhygromyxa sp.]